MTRVLVPIKILENTAVDAGLVELLAPVDVTVLGYHVLPEQTPADQARLQYEEQATSALETVSEQFAAAGGEADYRLVFTQDEQQTITRVADEIGAPAYVIPGVMGSIERLLVSLAGDVTVDRIATFLDTITADRAIEVTVVVAGDQPVRDRAEQATAQLQALGLTVTTEPIADKKPIDALVGAASEHDAIVMGKTAPSIRSFVFGEATNRAALASAGPVLVVR